jgi:hypothetical protein
MMKKEDFKKGEKVLFVPDIADGDLKHPDCEEGVVSSINNKFVFVNYRSGSNQATYRMHLVRLPSGWFKKAFNWIFRMQNKRSQ